MVVVNKLLYNKCVFKLKRRVKIKWGPDFAYAIGVIASDGYLNPDQKHIWISSAEEEMLLNFKQALRSTNKIGRYARGGEKEKRYFYFTFEDKIFYKFLNSIGITSAKSKTIKMVVVPDKYFGDFLRGLFDGDGSFYTFQDKRWPSSFGYQISFASASYDFVIWLKEKLTKLYGIKGFIRPGAGVFVIRYVKRDSIKLFLEMYKNKNKVLFLRRKYDKMNTVLLADRLYKKLKIAGVA